MNYYKISEQALSELLLAAHLGHALECGGVDNWPFYSEAISTYINDCSIIDEIDYKTLKDIVEADLAYYEKIV